jgi:HK97 family phage major capsid protein
MGNFTAIQKTLDDVQDKILTLAEKENRNLTDEEDAAFMKANALSREADKVSKKTSRSIPIPQPHRGEESETVRPFGEIGASYRRLFYGRDDARVPVGEKAEDFVRRALSSRTMVAGTMGDGGAAVPEYWWSDIYRDALQQSIALPRVRTFQMLSNILHIPAMDSEDQSSGFIGGVSASWQAEAAAANEVSPKLRMVTLTTHKLSMYVSASREVIEDSQNLSGVLTNQMVYALQQTMDEVILTGNGIARPLGILHSPARIDFTRAVANQIAFADVAGMFGRMHPSYVNGACWVAHPSAIPQLLAMADAGSNVIWRPAMGMTEGVVNMPLLGLPLLISDKIAPLGSRGDLMLVNFGCYALGIRQGTTLESTNSAYWSQDLFSFRVLCRLDGSSLLDAPITPRSGGTTLSPFVILD